VSSRVSAERRRGAAGVVAGLVDGPDGAASLCRVYARTKKCRGGGGGAATGQGWLCVAFARRGSAANVLLRKRAPERRRRFVNAVARGVVPREV
jgi:hypothetical protein